MATERKYKKNLELARGYMSTDEVTAAKNSRCKARNEIKREQRRKEAEERNQAWNYLTPYEQLEHLDRKLGKDVGAIKQRKKIKQYIETMGKRNN